ncbi:MAG: hypothetical protein IPM33_11790 [Phycisphaerales bacterium]|nr:hypothetical protein [Phycisphaerales bacterium]
MTLSLLVILSVIGLTFASVPGIMLHAYRHGARRDWSFLYFIAGIVLIFAFIPAAIGLQEGVWSTTHPLFILFSVLGMAGLLCHAVGWRCALRPRRPAADCPECGYSRGHAAICPECGAKNLGDIDPFRHGLKAGFDPAEWARAEPHTREGTTPKSAAQPCSPNEP